MDCAGMVMVCHSLEPNQGSYRNRIFDLDESYC